ncbi:hypothetical protein AXF42_Ash019203 [Apostasia shenzhenica]|uniref:Neprosin PEP catalytic domain-containing protein n=1 Tax=Apostasia shenzhenica TaxID=1088818 RepID=A0A2I0B2H5_9ASPA|nr:hypothetical protein AXF42_Ash019203 [Apostasia shenzhenica]
MASQSYSKNIIFLFFVWIYLVSFDCSLSIRDRVSSYNGGDMELREQNMPIGVFKGMRNIIPHQMNPGPNNLVKQWDVYTTYVGKDSFNGIQADFSVYGLPVAPNAASAAMMTVVNRVDPYNYSIIETGWHIDPRTYGDYDPHFYVSWTDDGDQKTGCLNLHCPGFVLHNSAKYIPGTKLWPLSRYGGDQRYVDLKLYKDNVSGNWWLYEGLNNYENPVGYFKKEIFSNNFDKASQLYFGGVTAYPVYSKASPLGSGHWYYEGDNKAAQFNHIKFIDTEGNAFAPDKSKVSSIVSINCYGISDFIYHDYGSSFFYGGPGKC